ncbi:heme ABC transporter ATP-binding protein [Lichenihabitans sp. PAMC28606]|uniref:heme ABC transporter ATP-binding protein n=1 Tax=Lichenihabitans sp. PAMC28606 TaxID=2880932 RepID=UPI001D0B5022|nr:heme ABC transporter ATP-binding protein [Lichenihabitans sp. PAMC28606]UDL95547.1 heme ABC transporter ATP-binding protein [Lichenihabitans sp. PAMC28606]
MIPLLEAEALTFAVRDAVLIRNAALTLDAGRVTIVVGPNGAGKSTLLKLLAGGLRAQSGSVRLDGRALHDFPAWQLSCRRAVLPQSAQVFVPFKAHQVAALGSDGVGRALGTIERAGIVESALVRAGVDHLRDRIFQTLSGGEQQRVHFARVLCQLAAGRSLAPSQLLFLDEPIASLDLRHQIGLLDELRALAREGTAVLAIIHDLNLAAAYADHLVVLDGGHLVAQGPPAEVMTDALLRDVFRVDLRVGAVPGAGIPFVLPTRRGP